MSDRLPHQITVAHTFLEIGNLSHYLTMFQAIARAFVDDKVPDASGQQIDEALETIAKKGRADDNAPKCMVECVEFLQMLRQTKQDVL